MKKLAAASLILALFGGALAAAPASYPTPTVSTTPTAPAKPLSSEASVLQLLDAMHAQASIDRVMVQVNMMMTNMTRQMGAMHHLTPDQQKTLSDFSKKEVETIRQSMAWDQVKDVYLKVYTQTFTQEEVDGMTAFYKTPAGQAMIDKMPAAMQKTMATMQPKMMGIIRKSQSDMSKEAERLSPAPVRPATTPAMPNGAVHLSPTPSAAQH